MPSWSHDLNIVCILGGAYLRDNHKNRLEQQGKLEAGTKPEEAPSNIGNQPDRMQRQCVVQMTVLTAHRIAQTSREKPVESLIDGHE